jgi:PcfJ-like protein
MIIATDKGCAAFSLLPDDNEPAKPTLTKELLEGAIAHARRSLRSRGCINVTEDAHRTHIGAFQSPDKVVIDRERQALYRSNPTGSFSLFYSKRKASTVFVMPFSLVETSIEQFLKDKNITPKAEGYDAYYYDQLRRATAKAINTAYRSPMRDILKQFSGAIWSRLDRDLLQVVIRTAGFAADSFDYTICWQNREQALETFRIAPGLMPVWLYTVQSLLTERHGHDGFTRAATYRSHLESKLDRLDCRMPPIVEDMQRRLALSPRGWRYLTRLNPLWSRTLLKQFSQPTLEATLKETAYMVEILAEAETIPSYSTFKAFIACAGAWVKTPHLIALARAAFAASRRARRKTRFVSDELSLIMEWFKDARPRLDANQQKAAWTWFVRQREEWHTHELDRKRAATEYKEWLSLIDNFTHDDFELVALTNSHALCEEAHLLHHCVNQYTDRCTSGFSRIFSLRVKESGERIATVELTNCGYKPGSSEWNGHNWTLSQVKGKYNQSSGLTAQAMAAVEALKAKYQELALAVSCPPPEDNDADEIFF